MLVITSDGRCYVGVLKACDQTVNIVMENTVERVFSEDVRTRSTLIPVDLMDRLRCCVRISWQQQRDGAVR